MYGARVLTRIGQHQIRNVIGYIAGKPVCCAKPSNISNLTVFLRGKTDNMSDSVKTDLRERLTPLQYHVTQEKGTERPFTGKYNKTTDPGEYSCIVCGQILFSSETKYDSGCGWPAFNDVLDQGLVKLSKDTSTVGANLLLLIKNPGVVRTEVQCAKCDAHLGHVFNDGPLPTKKRFCINSASIDFHPTSNEGKD